MYITVNGGECTSGHLKSRGFRNDVFFMTHAIGDIGLVPLVCDQIYIGLFHVECEQALKNY